MDNAYVAIVSVVSWKSTICQDLMSTTTSYVHIDVLWRSQKIITGDYLAITQTCHPFVKCKWTMYWLEVHWRSKKTYSIKIDNHWIEKRDSGLQNKIRIWIIFIWKERYIQRKTSTFHRTVLCTLLICSMVAWLWAMSEHSLDI
jgi:hypothetical protein